ncbi:hypothetical protein EON82_21600 [bacterium]|nr:MAG: hypothetical protein EON82_21600 [bacterium]
MQIAMNQWKKGLAKWAASSSIHLSLLVAVGTVLAAALLIGCAGKTEFDGEQGGVIRDSAGSPGYPSGPTG